MSRPAWLTAAGFRRLRDEHQALWQRRREVVAALSAAAAEGDRSENAEYIYRKKELREVDRRLRYLGRTLEQAEVVREAPADPSRARFGAWVTLEDEAGQPHRLRIVGAYEADPAQGLISLDAPLARAVLGKSVDDEIVFEAAGQRREWWLCAIQYEAEDRNAP